MMRASDWLSGLVGIIIAGMGLLPMLGYFSFLSDLSINLIRWIVVIAGLYLVVNSIREITNSNVVGWWSFIVAIVAVIIGLLPTLPWFNFQPLSRTVYDIALIAEGAFLVIATFAMEL